MWRSQPRHRITFLREENIQNTEVTVRCFETRIQLKSERLVAEDGSVEKVCAELAWMPRLCKCLVNSGGWVGHMGQ